jgi:hypothetical protein
VSVVGPMDLPPPLRAPGADISGIGQMMGAPESATSEMSAKVSGLVSVMGDVMKYIVENPEVAPIAKQLFSAMTGRMAKGARESGPVGVPPAAGLPAGPGLIPPGPSSPLPGIGGLR